MSNQELSKLEWAMTQYGEPIIRLAYSYVKNVDIAENIIQEVFLKDFAHHDPIRKDASFKKYLYRMTINRCKVHLRSGSFRNLFFTEVPHELHVENDVEDTVIRFEEDYDFGLQLLALPGKYREVLVLHYYQDFSITEIADIVKKSEQTIYTRLRTAKAQLKEIALKMEDDSIQLDKFTKKDVQRGIDTVIGKRVLFTPELRKKIRSKAKIHSLKQRLPNQWIAAAALGIAVIGIALIFILTPSTPIEAPNVDTNNPAQEDNLENDLSLKYCGIGDGTNGSTLEEG